MLTDNGLSEYQVAWTNIWNKDLPCRGPCNLFMSL